MAGQEVAVVGGGAEQHLGGTGALEVELDRVLPGERHSAEDLDGRVGGVPVDLRAECLGQAGHRGQFGLRLSRPGSPAIPKGGPAAVRRP